MDSENAEELLLDKTGLNEGEVRSKIKNGEEKELAGLLLKEFDKIKMSLLPQHWYTLLKWQEKVNRYKSEVYSFKVRDREVNIKTHTESLSHSQIPKVALPKYKAWGRYSPMDSAGKCTWGISLYRGIVSV